MKEQRTGWGKHGVILILSFFVFSLSQSLVYGGWTSVSPPSVSNKWVLAGVHFTSADEGWAVGTDYGDTNSSGVLLHYSGGTWASVTPPVLGAQWWGLAGVYFTSADEGWAVGYDYANNNSTCVLLHYSGGSWTPVTPPQVSTSGGLTGIYFTSANEGWAVGGGSYGAGILLHYSGGAWTSVAPPALSNTDWRLNGVHFTSAGEGWAVGEDNNSNYGILLHYSNGIWTSVSPPVYCSLESVYFTSANEGWVVGVFRHDNTGILLHYSNGTWTSVTPPTVSTMWWGFNSVYFTSADEGWAVGWTGYNNDFSVLLHYSQGSWTTVAPPAPGTSGGLSGLHFTSAEEGWAVGANNYNNAGALLHYSKNSFKTLTVTTSGAGTVASSPSGINCGATCSHGYIENTYVTLIPTPEKGSIFGNWSGDCTGTKSCKVKMSADKSVEALFTAGDCTYTISPKGKILSHKGGTIKITVKATGSTYCPAPEILNNTSWITVANSTFSGTKGSVTLTIPPLGSSVSRDNAITIGGKSIKVTQTGPPCTLTLSSASSGTFPSSGGTGSFTFTTVPTDCAWKATTGVSWLNITSAGSGAGDGEVDYAVNLNASKKTRSGKIVVQLISTKKTKSYKVKQVK